MKTVYFDCFSGISGDMTIGALLDVGLDFDYLKTELKKLPVEGYELRASRVMRSNLSAMKFDVLMEGAGENHTHKHLHGSHEHFHRKAAQILSMIRESSLSGGAKRFAVDIFTKLAISEGKVHSVPPDDVEFHEVGAIDSIVDTVGTAIGFDALGIGRFLCSAINVGTDDGFDLACAGSRIPQVPGGAVRGANVQLPDTAAGSLNPSCRLSGKLHLPKRQLHAVSGTNPVLHERSVWRGSVATAGRLRTSSDFRRVRRRYRTRIPQQIHTLSSGLG